MINIGIHLFDLLIWLFGNAEGIQIDHYSRKKVSGTLEMEYAKVNWTLSINEDDLPADYKARGKRYFREILIDGIPYRLDEGMENLHTECYREILAGNGPGIAEAAASIHLCQAIGNLCQ